MERKIPCPQHGTRFVHVHGPYGASTGYWHKCSKCSFRRWVTVNLFIIVASAVSLGIYVQNVLIYLKIF